MNDDNEITVEDVDTEANPTPGESIFDQFAPEPVVAVKGPDGLPVDKDPPWTFNEALPPPLTPKTMCCIAQPADPELGRTAALPKCSYYRRQRFISPRMPELPMIDRFCTHPSQRGLNGASLILKDCAMFQCELRDPPDPSAELVLDAIDAEKIAIGEQRLIDEGRRGPDESARRVVKGYRMFKSPEDVAKGRTTLSEEDFSEVED